MYSNSGSHISIFLTSSFYPSFPMSLSASHVNLFLFIKYAEFIFTSRACYALSCNVILQISTWLLCRMQGSADLEADLSWWSHLKWPPNLMDHWMPYSVLFSSNGLSSSEMLSFFHCLLLFSQRKACTDVFIGLRITYRNKLIILLKKQ